MSLKRFGLFGGSFDPVHIAHVALAQVALSQLQLDAVIWVPAGQPWQKTRTLASPAHRAAMLQLAIADEPRFTLERCELDRTGPSFTLDTVRALQVRAVGAPPTALIPRLLPRAGEGAIGATVEIGSERQAGIHSAQSRGRRKSLYSRASGVPGSGFQS